MSIAKGRDFSKGSFLILNIFCLNFLGIIMKINSKAMEINCRKFANLDKNNFYSLNAWRIEKALHQTVTHKYSTKLCGRKRAQNKNSKSFIKHVQNVTTFDSR